MNLVKPSLMTKRTLPQIRHSKSCLSTKSLGIKRVNQYVLLKTLGMGTSSTVVQCIEPQQNGDDTQFAMKIIKRAKVKSMSEFESHRKLNHPFIIKLHEIIDDPKEPNLYLVMDYLGGGSLEN